MIDGSTFISQGAADVESGGEGDMLFETPGWETGGGRTTGDGGQEGVTGLASGSTLYGKAPGEREGGNGPHLPSSLSKKRKSQAKARREESDRKRGRGVDELVKDGRSTRVPSRGPVQDQNKDKESKLLKQMQTRLETGRFRQINEMLYTQDSQSSESELKRDPGLYQDYHSGFREATNKWPVKPLDLIIQWLETLARTERNVKLVADLGCGDARLGLTLSRSDYRVCSFDLVGDLDRGGQVAPADIARLVPLSSGIVDIVIICLALMPTNWPSILGEAHRILRVGGLVKLAEVTSRLKEPLAFSKALTLAGFGVTKEKTSNSHFVLWTLTKKSSDFDAAKISGELLQPCIYKRR